MAAFFVLMDIWNPWWNLGASDSWCSDENTHTFRFAFATLKHTTQRKTSQRNVFRQIQSNPNVIRVVFFFVARILSAWFGCHFAFPFWFMHWISIALSADYFDFQCDECVLFRWFWIHARDSITLALQTIHTLNLFSDCFAALLQPKQQQ